MIARRHCCLLARSEGAALLNWGPDRAVVWRERSALLERAPHTRIVHLRSLFCLACMCASQ